MSDMPCVQPGGLGRVIARVQIVPMAQVRFVCRLRVTPRAEMRGSLSVVLGGVFKVLRRFSVVVNRFGGHVKSPQGCRTAAAYQ
jgi:hypothetical protein